MQTFKIAFSVSSPAALAVAMGLLSSTMGGCQTDTAAARPNTDLSHLTPTGDVSLAPLQFEDGDEGLAFVDGRTGAALTYDDVMVRARAADVTLVGEQHDQLAHHQFQARVIRSLGKDGGLTVGLEMLPSTMTEPLDRFRRGEIDGDGLAAATNWGETWGYDYELYRPVLDAVKDTGSNVRGINAPRSLVRALAQRGVDGLTDDEKASMPELDVTDEKHRSGIYDVFKNHHPPTKAGPSQKAFERFYLVQVLWDEAMADGASRSLDDGAKRVVVVAGNGHVAGYRGIPNRIVRRKPTSRVLTIVQITLTDGEDVDAVVTSAIKDGAGDIIVVVRPREVLSV